MKNIYRICCLLAAFAFTACGRSGSTASEQLDTATTNNTFKNTDEGVGKGPRKVELDASTSAGAALIAKSDCLGCHNETSKLAGPSYTEIAAKYTTGDVDILAAKIIKGGAGSFGDVPMPPHPDLPAQDAKAMVTYILSMKTEQKK